ncbi:MAG: hypothetical protein AB1566_04595 [Chloroflexota bacterium]
MRRTVIVHLIGAEDLMVAELDDLPKPTDMTLTVTNPRKRDGKPLPYVTAGATSLILPWHRISFVEVMMSEAERREAVEFFRET